MGHWNKPLRCLRRTIDEAVSATQLARALLWPPCTYCKYVYHVSPVNRPLVVVRLICSAATSRLWGRGGVPHPGPRPNLFRRHVTIF